MKATPEKPPRKPAPKRERGKVAQDGEPSARPQPEAPAGGPQPGGRALRTARLLHALEAVEEAAAQSVVRKVAAGQALSRAELDSVPRLRSRLERRLALEDADDDDDDAAPAKASTGGVAGTLREVAVHFGRGVRTVQNWKADGMPALPGGGYDLGAIAAWLEDRHPKALGGGTLREEREYWEAKYRQLKCELTEIRLRMERGELIDREVEEARIVEILREFRARVLAAPGALAPALVGLDVLQMKAMLERRMADVLESLSRL